MFAAARDFLQAVTAVTITYTVASTAAASSVSATTASDGGALGVDAPDRGNRRFLLSEVDVAQPVALDTITDAYGTWSVNHDGIKDRPGGMWLLTCSRAHLSAYEGSSL